MRSTISFKSKSLKAGFILLQSMFLVLLILLPRFVLSASESVTVSALVDSDVSASKSTITANPTDVMADGIESSIIIVTAKDDADNPLSSKKVVISSNRGKIDIIEPDQTYTNIVGEASFNVRSEVAGLATFSAFVDNAVTLDNTTQINFQRLPSSTPITITTTIPPMFGMPEKTITLFSPTKADEKDLLVRSGIRLEIPFGLFFAGGLFAISQPILLSVLIMQFTRSRRREDIILEKESKLIEKINNSRENSG